MDDGLTGDGSGDVLTVPEAAQASIRAAELEVNKTLLHLGSLEADYLREKHRLLRALEEAQLRRKQMLDGIARALGLDIDNLRWNFDFEKMTFTPHRSD